MAELYEVLVVLVYYPFVGNGRVPSVPVEVFSVFFGPRNKAMDRSFRRGFGEFGERFSRSEVFRANAGSQDRSIFRFYEFHVPETVQPRAFAKFSERRKIFRWNPKVHRLFKASQDRIKNEFLPKGSMTSKFPHFRNGSRKFPHECLDNPHDFKILVEKTFPSSKLRRAASIGKF